jgi:hypothetical protein
MIRRQLRNVGNHVISGSQFLELSVPCPDVIESLAWYRQLGFTELRTADIRQHHYAVVTDGSFCIGLHAAGNHEFGLSFVRKNLARHVRDTMLNGVDFEYAQLGIDEFHEAALRDPDGTCAILLEARTFSGAMDGRRRPITGGVVTIGLPCMNLNASLAFWQQHGFIAVEAGEENSAELHMPGLIVLLREGTRIPELHFQPPDFDASRSTMQRARIPLREGADGYSLTSPEGLRLIVSRALTDSLA